MILGDSSTTINTVRLLDFIVEHARKAGYNQGLRARDGENERAGDVQDQDEGSDLVDEADADDATRGQETARDDDDEGDDLIDHLYYQKSMREMGKKLREAQKNLAERTEERDDWRKRYGSVNYERERECFLTCAGIQSGDLCSTGLIVANYTVKLHECINSCSPSLETATHLTYAWWIIGSLIVAILGLVACGLWACGRADETEHGNKADPEGQRFEDRSDVVSREEADRLGSTATIGTRQSSFRNDVSRIAEEHEPAQSKDAKKFWRDERREIQQLQSEVDRYTKEMEEKTKVLEEKRRKTDEERIRREEEEREAKVKDREAKERRDREDRERREKEALERKRVQDERDRAEAERQLEEARNMMFEMERKVARLQGDKELKAGVYCAKPAESRTSSSSTLSNSPNQEAPNPFRTSSLRRPTKKDKWADKPDLNLDARTGSLSALSDQKTKEPPPAPPKPQVIRHVTGARTDLMYPHRSKLSSPQEATSGAKKKSWKTTFNLPPMQKSGGARGSTESVASTVSRASSTAVTGLKKKLFSKGVAK